MAATAPVALALAGALVGPPPPGGPTWLWPVGDGAGPAVAATFDAPDGRWGPGHRGIDLRTTKGADVTSVAQGVVTHRGRIAGRGTLSITHGSGIRSTYEPVVSDLSVGDPVRAGQVVGHLGPGTNHCAPRTCLHVGAKRGEGYLDPLPFFGVRRVVLLPVP